LKANLPSHHSHFAPLVGLLVGAAAERLPQLDFLHPRKKPVPKSNKRQWSLVAGLAAVIVLAVLASIASQVWALDAQIAEKNTRIAELSKNTKTNEATLKAMKELGEWKVTDFAMVKEFESLLKLLPDAKSLKLTSLNFISSKETGGRFVINGVASSSDVVSKMIRDVSTAKAELPHPNPKFKREVARYVAKQDSLKEDNSNPPYKVSFTATIELQKPNPVAMVVNPAAQTGGKASVLARTNAPAKTGATKANSTQSAKEKASPTKPDAKLNSPATAEKESKPSEKSDADEPKSAKADAKKPETKSSTNEDKAEKAAPVKSGDSEETKTKKPTDASEPKKADEVKTAPETKATDDKKPDNAKSEGST
jgi:Tfp pilus assembly protein PilN